MERVFQIKNHLLIIILLMFSVSVIAQDTLNEDIEKDLKFIKGRYSFNLGGFIVDLNSDISISSEKIGAGIIINLEDILGLQASNTVLRGGFKYVFSKNKKHSIAAGYFSFLRKAEKALRYEIEFGGFVYPIGTKVNSRFDMQIYKAVYGYSFFKDNRIDLGISAGFYVMPISFELKAFSFNTQRADFVAPLPLIGLYSSFAITPKFYLKQHLELLYFDAFKMKGSISDLYFGVEYKPLKHLGLGLAANSFRVNISIFEKKDTFFDFQGSVKTGYTGVIFYGILYF